MNNNNLYNTNSWIGTTHLDFFNNSSNNLYFYTSNTSNILSNQIKITSNIIENDILITSNILENHSSNYTSNLKYNINQLINEEIEHNLLPIPYDLKHTYIYNSNLLGEIRFYCENTKDFPVLVPLGVPDYRVKIDVDGKLKVYYTYDPAINLTFMNGWVDVANSIVALNASDANIGVTLAGLGASIASNYAYFEQKIDSLLFGLKGLGILNDNDIIGLQERFSKFKYETFPTNAYVASIFNDIKEFFRTGIANYLERAFNNITIRITQNPTASFFLGLGGLAFTGATSAIQNMQYLEIISSILNSNITSNSNISSQRRIELLSSNMDEYISTSMDYCSNMYNFSIAQGFTNSNILTTQYINSINTNQISLSNLNFSNIFITSNIASNTSNTIFNNYSNLNLNSSNNLFNYSSNIDFNSSNTIFNSNQFLVNNYTKTIIVKLPNTNYTYDGLNNVYIYDLDISKYVPYRLIQQSPTLFIKTRIFRITTFLSTDFNNLQFTNLNNLTGNAICYPETLLIYMSNDKNTSGIHTADDNYCNGLIYGKQNSDKFAGYWNIIDTNFNYLRFITGVGFDMNIVVEPILF